jgi:hypothetical protein
LKVGRWCLVFVTPINIFGIEITEKRHGKGFVRMCCMLSGLYENGSGERHKKDLDRRMAEIVRVLDYIIGRLSGKYFQADPFGIP